MGKTAAGALWLDARLTSPFDFFQYFLNVDDRDVVRYLKLLTFEPLEAIAAFERATGADLRTAKRLLASSVTAIVHGEQAAREADAAARAAFGGDGRAEGTRQPTDRRDRRRRKGGRRSCQGGTGGVEERRSASN